MRKLTQFYRHAYKIGSITQYVPRGASQLIREEKNWPVFNKGVPLLKNISGSISQVKGIKAYIEPKLLLPRDTRNKPSLVSNQLCSSEMNAILSDNTCREQFETEVYKHATILKLTGRVRVANRRVSIHFEGELSSLIYGIKLLRHNYCGKLDIFSVVRESFGLNKRTYNDLIFWKDQRRRDVIEKIKESKSIQNKLDITYREKPYHIVI